MRAYHFLRDDMTAGSGNEPPWVEGEERTYKGEVKLCHSGYHSSPSWFDVLQYAPGAMACIVEVSKPIEKDKDKQVSRTRKLIKARDASRVLRLFACDCAERAMKKTGCTDKRSWNAVRVSRLYADGKATKSELSAAWSAAVSAAWSAAESAVGSAAWSAAESAVGSARSAAWSARSAEIKWQKARLNKYMNDLFKEEK